MAFPRQHGATFSRSQAGAGTTDTPVVAIPSQRVTVVDATQPARSTSKPSIGSRGSRLGPFASWCRTYGFAVEVVLSIAAGVAIAMVASEMSPASVGLAMISMSAWAVTAFHKPRTVTSPLPRQLRIVVQSVVVGLATCSVLALFQLPENAMVAGVAAVVGAGAVSAACRALRWQLQAPVRVLLVGDRVALSQAIARWNGERRVLPVAAILVEPDLDEIPDQIMGVPTLTGLEAAPAIVEKHKADLVVVAPGPGFTSTDLRRLSWRLEETRAALGVTGVLDSVAPIRITPGSIHRTTVMDLRLPQPSPWVRGVKYAVDRVAAFILLALVSPVLMVLFVLVKIDSRGPVLFVQKRVGQRGREFDVIKIRTMVRDADAVKAEMIQSNEFDSVLFKMKADPRITRLGRLLRKYSLDELPQLINVVRGEMSLVGPRPHLPSEVANMPADALRRLAVRPGITGLWQVSGRSDLAYDEAAELDTYYADNWTLAGDLAIGLRTVKAVVSAKGAY